MATVLAGVFAFFQITKQEISVIREQINLMEDFHREDMKNMNDKWSVSLNVFCCRTKKNNYGIIPETQVNEKIKRK